MAPPRLSPELVDKLGSFTAENDLAELYRAYEWGEDKHSAGFPRILELEARLTGSSRTTGVTIEDVKAVADWGGMRGSARVRGPGICLPAHGLYGTDGRPLGALTGEPERPILALSRVKGIGPTYASKVLRFAMPWDYGAIDSRCVRTFGSGDQGEARGWIPLIAKPSGHRWCIPKRQPGWPGGYGAWIRVLRHFVGALPPNCPHPPSFVKRRLRQKGVWGCADVEMALFAYATHSLRPATTCRGHEAELPARLRIAESTADRQIANESAGWRSTTTRGGGRAKGFRWRYSPEDDAVQIVNENDRKHRFPLDEVRQILSDLHGHFRSGFFPLANNVATMGRGTEQAGLGMTILRQRPGDVTHAQGASYLGVVLEEMGYLLWNGKPQGIKWRIIDENFRREALLRRTTSPNR